MTSQSSDDPDDVTLGEEDQEELSLTRFGHVLEEYIGPFG